MSPVRAMSLNEAKSLVASLGDRLRALEGLTLAAFVLFLALVIVGFMTAGTDLFLWAAGGLGLVFILFLFGLYATSSRE
jgi:hypothetical protein